MLSNGALSGVRVVDAATLGAAPLAAALLSEFGAEVIKVEQPKGGDPLRQWGAQKNGIGLMWKSLGRNKKSITLDFHQPEGRELLQELVRHSDVLVVNTRPGTLKRWGLDYEHLREINEGLVMLHITGFGQGGPYSDRPGFGTLGEAMSGFAHMTGQPDGPPTLPPFMLADASASLTATYAVAMALYHRDVHGASGQFIDVNLIEPLARILEQSVLVYDQLGDILERSGNRWDLSAPRNAYQTKDGRWLAMSGSAPAAALRVFRAIGRPDMAQNPEYTDAQKRLQHADEIDQVVAEWIAEHTLEEAMVVFEREEVAAAPIYDPAQLLEDPHLQARQMHLSVPDPDLGYMRVQAPVPRLSDTPGEVHHLGPSLGAYNREVYLERLGLTEDQLEKLQSRGVI